MSYRPAARSIQVFQSRSARWVAACRLLYSACLEEPVTVGSTAARPSSVLQAVHWNRAWAIVKRFHWIGPSRTLRVQPGQTSSVPGLRFTLS